MSGEPTSFISSESRIVGESQSVEAEIVKSIETMSNRQLIAGVSRLVEYSGSKNEERDQIFDRIKILTEEAGNLIDRSQFAVAVLRVNEINNHLIMLLHGMDTELAMILRAKEALQEPMLEAEDENQRQKYLDQISYIQPILEGSIRKNNGLLEENGNALDKLLDYAERHSDDS